ncbi:putative reverse transcriptase domain, reverse transcriptase zinc-binding domain protein [Tanacetum coccineum]
MELVLKKPKPELVLGRVERVVSRKINPTDSVLRSNGLKVGDSNSAYFHISVKSRNQRCQIEVIKDEQNVIFSGPAIPSAFVSHYEMFLGSAMACTNLNIEGLFTSKVSESSYLNMVRHVSDLEIKEAMFSIGDDRAPGPDGYTSAFFKKDGILRISDNILITHELMHNYHRNRGPPRCAFKVDIQKAYDTVDWVFLGKRGLRQGDPMSPYLFTLVMEVLTLMLKRRVRVSDSFRYHNHCEELQIINVCFADDIFMFARGDVESARVIMESLDEFMLSSGLVPSIPKSTTFFCNVLNHVKIVILNIMPFSEGELPIKYLRVPLISSRLLNKDCKVLVEKAKNKIEDWKDKSLSFAGRLQLCKSVISSMHIYWASVLAIPKGIILDIQNLICGFLWCNGDYKRGKAKVAWVNICLPLSEGGLGLRSLEVFNKTLLTTHIWNIVSNKESLWVQWIHTYKLTGRSLWDILIKADVSWGWFLSPREISNVGYNTCSKVSDLMVHNAWNWPSSWLIKAPELGLVPTPSIQMDTSDVLQWRDSNRSISEFLVKKVCEAIRPRGEEVDWYHMVWFSYCVPRNTFLLWLMMRNSLKTQHILKQWDVGINTDLNLIRCSLCDLQADSREHLFFECSYSTQVWATVRHLASMDNVPSVLQNIMLYLKSMAHKRTAKSIIGSGVASCSYGAPSDCVAISMPKCLSGLHLLMYSASYVWLADIVAWKFFKANWDVS